MKMWEKLKSAALVAKDFVLDFLFPKDITCIFCGRDIPNFKKQPYCDKCGEEAFNTGKLCKICDDIVTGDGDICDACISKTSRGERFFKHAYCPLVYNEVTKSSILAFKDSRAFYLVPTFAKFMAERVKQGGEQFDIVIYVPMTKEAEKIRGYNQSKLLAEEVGRLLGVPVQGDVVEKVKNSGKQKKLGAAEREKNLIGSFSLVNKAAVSGKNVLIVDDIVTTGATADAIARLMPSAKSVSVCALARNRKK